MPGSRGQHERKGNRRDCPPRSGELTWFSLANAVWAGSLWGLPPRAPPDPGVQITRTRLDIPRGLRGGPRGLRGPGSPGRSLSRGPHRSGSAPYNAPFVTIPRSTIRAGWIDGIKSVQWLIFPRDMEWLRGVRYYVGAWEDKGTGVNKPSREGAPGRLGQSFGFPLPPLKFRTAGFPQYGFKWTVNGDLRRQPEA